MSHVQTTTHFSLDTADLATLPRARPNAPSESEAEYSVDGNLGAGRARLEDQTLEKPNKEDITLKVNMKKYHLTLNS